MHSNQNTNKKVNTDELLPEASYLFTRRCQTPENPAFVLFFTYPVPLFVLHNIRVVRVDKYDFKPFILTVFANVIRIQHLEVREFSRDLLLSYQLIGFARREEPSHLLRNSSSLELRPLSLPFPHPHASYDKALLRFVAECPCPIVPVTTIMKFASQSIPSVPLTPLIGYTESTNRPRPMRIKTNPIIILTTACMDNTPYKT